jgi:hypothetical protein
MKRLGRNAAAANQTETKEYMTCLAQTSRMAPIEKRPVAVCV